MLQIFPDELLHSYVLRIIISHGLANRPSNIKNIISSTALMRYDLILTEQQAMIFSAFPVTTLMELVRDHMPVQYCSKYLNPKSLAAKCGRIFFHRQTGVPEETIFGDRLNNSVLFPYKLHHCPECIREQIQEHGSGWFKLNWVSSKYCDVHNLKLISLKQQACSCKLNVLDKIVSILSGVCVCCKSEAELPPKNTPPIHSDVCLLTQENHEEISDVSVSDCFMRSFEKWVIAFNRGLDDDAILQEYIYELTSYTLQPLSLYERYGGRIEYNFVWYLMKTFEHSLSEYFCDFLDQHTETLAIACSDCVPAQIFVDFKVAKDRDCETCEVENEICPLKR